MPATIEPQEPRYGAGEAARGATWLHGAEAARRAYRELVRRVCKEIRDEGAADGITIFCKRPQFRERDLMR